MTTGQVVETSVTVNNNSPIQDYVHPDNQTQPTLEMTPGFKPFTVIPILLASTYNSLKLFTVVFCSKQRQGNGLKLKIIGLNGVLVLSFSLTNCEKYLCAVINFFDNRPWLHTSLLHNIVV